MTDLIINNAPIENAPIENNNVNKENKTERIFIDRRTIGNDRRASVSAVENAYARKNNNNNGNIRQKISQRILLAQRTEYTTVVCNDSGISGALQIPYIANYALSYSHPLADISNARGIAQQGKEYLRKLDVQTLAGILIIICNDYDLFRYQPADSGAQKNAILRTAGKDLLVKAILLVEGSVHSNNYLYLPKLSLIMDSTVTQGGIANRIHQWLALLVEAIYKPDVEEYDENLTVRKIQKIKAASDAKAELLERRAEKRNQQALKADCKVAQLLVKDLYKQSQIVGKFKIFLQNVFTEFSLTTMESGAKFLLISKLETIVAVEAKKLIDILETDRSGLTTQKDILDEIMETPTESAVYIVKADSTTQENVRVLAVSPIEEIPEGKIRIFLAGKSFIVDTSYNKLAFMDKIRMNKALLAGTVS